MAITERQLAGNQRRTLRAMRARLITMSQAWDGVDQFNMTELELLADKCEEVATAMVADADSPAQEQP